MSTQTTINTIRNRFEKASQVQHRTDNGTEFACHEMIGKSLGVTICFADPYASWQKGAIENANGLIRQYVPKTETFEHVSHQQITKYSKKINIRPRKKLEFKTPYECFYEQIK